MWELSSLSILSSLFIPLIPIIHSYFFLFIFFSYLLLSNYVLALIFCTCPNMGWSLSKVSFDEKLQAQKKGWQGMIWLAFGIEKNGQSSFQIMTIYFQKFNFETKIYHWHIQTLLLSMSSKLLSFCSSLYFSSLFFSSLFFFCWMKTSLAFHLQEIIILVILVRSQYPHRFHDYYCPMHSEDQSTSSQGFVHRVMQTTLSMNMGKNDRTKKI